MQQIDVDFDVWKELTSRRTHEGHSYNEVLRDLLGLKPGIGRQLADVFGTVHSPGKYKSFALRGGELVEGTQLRAVYKGEEHLAFIRDGRWVDSEGQEHSSPSAAASAICGGTNVNGLRFWHAKRPTDREYVRLDILLATAK